MIVTKTREFLSVVLSLALISGSLQVLNGYQAPAPTSADDVGTPTEPAPQSESQLEALVAPIALYPDALVAQVLGASTFPDQVAIANYWLQQNKNLTGSALTTAVDQQTWDASVKALTQFPSVLANLASNLAWTSSLGEAYHNQQAAVMAAVQALRAKAQSAGNLKSTPQITVVQQSPQTIVIQPANPQIVYVPQYNPAVIYGYPYVTPGYSAADMAAVGLLSFGAGIAVGAAISGGWGWNSWNCNWHGGVVVYNHNTFYGNTAWHGGYYNGGYHGGYGYNNYNNYNHNNYNNYNHNTANTYNRNSGNTYNRNVNNVNVNRSGSQNANNSWSHANTGGSTAFSGMSGHSGGVGGSDGGWSSRAESNRGWGSMRSSGFSGGGGFGGFRGGGGFRR